MGIGATVSGVRPRARCWRCSRSFLRPPCQFDCGWLSRGFGTDHAGDSAAPDVSSGDMIGTVGLVAQEVCYGYCWAGWCGWCFFPSVLAGHYIGTIGLQLSV